MQSFVQVYYRSLKDYIDGMAVTDGAGVALDFLVGMERVAELLLSQSQAGNKIFFIGNGASAAISSHMATDYWKNGGMRAMAFNDGALLTCMGNDYGYDQVFAKPLEMFAEAGDVLMAISSSGQSANILKAAAAAREKLCRVVTFSGFKPDNPLRSLGDYNFYVPAQAYGPVEILHHAICHGLLDAINHQKQVGSAGSRG